MQFSKSKINFLFLVSVLNNLSVLGILENFRKLTTLLSLHVLLFQFVCTFFHVIPCHVSHTVYFLYFRLLTHTRSFLAYPNLFIARPPATFPEARKKNRRFPLLLIVRSARCFSKICSGISGDFYRKCLQKLGNDPRTNFKLTASNEAITYERISVPTSR